MKNVSVFLLSIFLVSLFACSSDSESGRPEAIVLDVYKSPTCGCCGKWVSHIEEKGFEVEVHNHNSLDPVKKKLGIPSHLQSCHTGVSESGYFFEGHIPAKYITQFLSKPTEGAVGLAVPGMPAGSPGMEMGDQFSPYEILLVKSDGSTEVFARVSRYEEQF